MTVIHIIHRYIELFTLKRFGKSANSTLKHFGFSAETLRHSIYLYLPILKTCSWEQLSVDNFIFTSFTHTSTKKEVQ